MGGANATGYAVYTASSTEPVHTALLSNRHSKLGSGFDVTSYKQNEIRFFPTKNAIWFGAHADRENPRDRFGSFRRHEHHWLLPLAEPNMVISAAFLSGAEMNGVGPLAFDGLHRVTAKVTVTKLHCTRNEHWLPTMA